MIGLIFNRFIGCLIGLSGVTYGAWGQSSDTARVHVLQEVEVSAVRRPSTVRSTVPLQVLSKEELTKLGYQSLADAVRRFAGVTVRDYGGIGGLKTVSVRSLGAHHTAVLYDGVAVSTARPDKSISGVFRWIRCHS